MDEIMLKVKDVSKEYQLGQIGGTTLRDELQRLSAKRRGKEDPTKIIGTEEFQKGEKFLALNEISFSVKKGERIGIIGRNGAGKSTLLKLISRITTPTKGTIGLNGRVASMLEVGTGFHPELTGRENIYMNGAILGMKKKEIDAKLEDIIEFSECRDFIDTPVKRYSSGMYVKLAFSVAAHLDAEIMIMDEVLTVGDMAFQKKCIDKMNDTSKKENRTILYVSHNMNTIRQLCDRVIVLKRGKVIYDGEVEKGIELYSGNIQIASHTILLDEKRKSDTLHDGFRFTSLTLTDREMARYNVGEKICFTTKQTVTKSFSNLLFRIIVHYFDGSSATMITTLTPKCIKSDFDGSIYFEADTTRVAPGLYSMVLCAYELNGYGSSIFYDVIDEGVINFEVVADEQFNNGMQWNHAWWGHTTSPELIANVEEKSSVIHQ